MWNSKYDTYSWSTAVKVIMKWLQGLQNYSDFNFVWRYQQNIDCLYQSSTSEILQTKVIDVHR